MELVYLWVSNYKNIVDQGFNFNPKLNCTFKNEELHIKERNFIDFYPKNIFINSIVGENGSSKTSIIELLLLSFFKSKETHYEKKDESTQFWLLVYDNEKNNFFISTSDSLTKINEVKTDLKTFKITLQDNKLLELHHLPFNLHYNPSIELMSSFFFKSINSAIRATDAAMYEITYKPHSTINLFSFPSKQNGTIDIRNNENTSIINMFKARNSLGKDILSRMLAKTFSNNSIRYIPKELSLTFNKSNFHNKLSEKIDFSNKSLDFNQQNLTLKAIYKYFLILILHAASYPTNYDRDVFTDFFLEEGELKKYISDKYYEFEKTQTSDSNLTKAQDFIFYMIENIEDFIDKFKDTKLKDTINNKLLDFDVHYTAALIDTLNKKDIKDLELKLLKIVDIIDILEVLPSYIDVTIYDKNKRNFNDLSSGEKNIIIFIYSLIYYIDFFREESKTIYIALDEIEIGLNPDWQKRLIKTIINLLSQFKNKFIITVVSHSPFILSDFPKESVLFLKNGKQVIPKIETFGANIHTLLSNDFFIKDGLMGEFAKDSINKIYNSIKHDNRNIFNNSKEIDKAIDMIGEPLIKKELKNLLLENSEINIKIKLLKKELKILKGLKNDPN